jgi:hypothetical protein
MRKGSLFCWLGAGALLSVGCGGSGGVRSELVDVSQAALQKMTSCDELTAALRADALSKMNRRIDAEVQAIKAGYGNYGYDERFASAGGGAALGAGPTNNAAVSAAAGSGTGAASMATPPPAHSNTETQVKGVDEADIVKTDGNFLYVLHGNEFLIVDSWPATSLAMTSSTPIDGEPLEMFVDSGQAVVFSHVDGTAIYAAAGVTPRPEYSDVYSPGVYGVGVAGGGGGAPVAAVGAPAGGALAVPRGGGGYPPGYYPNELTKVTVLAISTGQATVTREMYFEGSYLTSRRVDSLVRVILSGGVHGPAIDYSPTFPTPSAPTTTGYAAPTTDQQIQAWEDLRRKNQAAIAATTYADWVPVAFARSGGQVGTIPTACDSFYIPTTGTAELGLTQIASFDLSSPSHSPQGAAILSAVSTVYGNTESIVLAGQAYVDPWTLREAYAYSSYAGQNGPPPIPVQTLSYTTLHVFDLLSDPSIPRYTGSGTVPGDVKDQFSIDENSGIVRVTTTEQRSGPPLPSGKQNRVSHVYALTDQRGRFSISGDAGEIAPGEQLYATRYVGDKAYVVTWNVTDPLFVVDVSNPYAVKVLGQVQIPGFSTYIHPLDATHLLTIGRETDSTGHQHTTGGYWFGIALQVFDVTNPLAPMLQYKYVYDGGDYATTESMDNHKAFTYFDDKKLLAFPYEHQGSYGSTGQSSTLEVFQVGVAEGINKVGSVSHAGLLATLPNGDYGYCGGYYDGAVRRGVFIGDYVYSISYGGIIASPVASLATPTATLQLGPPTLAGACQ